jgi:hypothetical protein
VSDRGSALIEALTLGFVTLLVVGQVLVTVGRLAAAGELAAESARHAAVLAAEGATLEEAAAVAAALAPGSAVDVSESGGSVTVAVVVRVSVVGPGSGPVTTEVRGVATVTRSPYRSGP